MIRQRAEALGDREGGEVYGLIRGTGRESHVEEL